MVMIYSLACVAYFSTFRAFCLYALFPFAWILWAWFLNKRPATRVEFAWTSYVFLIIWFVPLIIFYVYTGIHASPEPWGVFNTSVSPLGRSPCCKSLGSACNGVPFHPAGFFVYGSQAPKLTQSDVMTFCAVGRWADSNGLVPVSYNRKEGSADTIGSPCVAGAACDGLATLDPKDYPNLGIGLRDGYAPGALTSPTSLCPGVSRIPNDRGVVGKGTEICARCMHSRPAHCTATEGSQMFCFLCPGGYDDPIIPSYRDVRFGAELLFAQFLLMFLATCVSMCGRGFKGYNKFF